jgi:hypothetical protein
MLATGNATKYLLLYTRSFELTQGSLFPGWPTGEQDWCKMGLGHRSHVVPYRGLKLLLQLQVWQPMGTYDFPLFSTVPFANPTSILSWVVHCPESVPVAGT